MFGKRISHYLGFQKVVLGILAAVGLGRLGLSLASLPDTTVAWLSMNVVAWAGALYYGVAVYTRGFGSYKQILPLVSIQTLLQQGIAVLGILLAIAGKSNIYAAPEFSFGASQWVHLLAHMTVGIVVPPLLLWGAASLALLVTKRVATRARRLGDLGGASAPRAPEVN
jgi:hypothetical protein